MKNSVRHFRKHWIILLAILSAPAHAEFRHFNEWTNTEKGLFLAYQTAAYIDHRQTRVGLRNGYVEANPLYGTHPHRDKSIAINLAFSSLMYYTIGHYAPDDTNALLLGGVVARTSVVVHNDNIGISWKVAF